MKITSKKATADMVSLLIILVIFATTALIVARGIGDSTLAASEKMQLQLKPVEYEDETTPEDDENIEEPTQNPDEDRDDPTNPDLLPSEEYRLSQCMDAFKTVEKELLKTKNYNIRGYKLERHELYLLQEYLTSFNGKVFVGKTLPTGIIHDVLRKYKII